MPGAWPCPDHEAQDLHLAQWRLLRAAVAPGPDGLFAAASQHSAPPASAAAGPTAWARQRYWHALPDGREGRAYQEFLAPRRPLLAWSYATCPACSCDPAYAPGYPAPAESGLVAAARARYGVSIGDLVGAGLLRRERSSSAQVTKAMPPPVRAPPRDRRRKMPELTRVAHCARSGGDSDRDSLDGAPAAASDRLGGPSRQLVGSGGRRG